MWWCSSSSLPVAAPVMFNFMPSWWYREYGIAHGERIFMDPEHRARTVREMNRLAFERFGDAGLGHPDPPLAYLNDDINNATMPAALGCEVVFADDQYAANVPLTEEQVRNLHVPEDIAEAFPMREVIRQARWVSDHAGQALPPSWCLMGLPNIAVRTRGADFFGDLLGEPELAAKVLDASQQLMLSSLDYFREVGTAPPTLWNQNCTVPLAGPRTYEACLLPYDRELHAEAARRGLTYAIHHCGHFDTYAPLYRTVGPLEMVEIGWGSDLRLALDTFPEARVQCIIGYQHVRDATPAEIRGTMRDILEVAGPDVGRLSFNVADLEYGTPHENVRAVVEGLLTGA